MFRSVPCHRLSAPFGWESHPCSLGSDACSDSSHGRALPAARLVVEPACGRLQASCPPKRAPMSCRDGASRARPFGLAFGWRRRAPSIQSMRSPQISPCGSPHHRLPVKAPDGDDIPIRVSA